MSWLHAGSGSPLIEREGHDAQVGAMSLIWLPTFRLTATAEAMSEAAGLH